MDEFQKPLRRFYQDQRLSAERAAEIMAAGQAIAVRRKRRTFWLRGLAAAVVIGVGILASHSLREANRFPGSPRLAVADVAGAVVSFFAQSNPQLGRISNDRTSLTAWLATRGSLSAFDLPGAIATLESFGCQVLDVRGQKVSLLCFFIEEAPGTSSADSTKPAPRPLVHLLAAPRSAFRDSPRPGERVHLDPTADWKFVSWVKGDVLFVAASDAPAEVLAKVFNTL